MRRTRLWCSQLTSFLSCFCGRRVLFYQLSRPAAEHLSDFVQWLRKASILFRINGFCFPQNHEENFCGIHFADGQANEWQLLGFCEKGGCCGGFNGFNEKGVNPPSDSIAVHFRQDLVALEPEEVVTFQFLHHRQHSRGGGA